MLSPACLERVREFYAPDGAERIGIITNEGSVVEFQNLAQNPKAESVVSANLLMQADKYAAFWHTHPGQSCNLSKDDYSAFLNYPGHLHIIVGSDGLAIYYIEDGSVIRHE